MEGIRRRHLPTDKTDETGPGEGNDQTGEGTVETGEISPHRREPIAREDRLGDERNGWAYRTVSYSRTKGREEGLGGL